MLKNDKILHKKIKKLHKKNQNGKRLQEKEEITEIARNCTKRTMLRIATKKKKIEKLHKKNKNEKNLQKKETLQKCTQKNPGNMKKIKKLNKIVKK